MSIISRASRLRPVVVWLPVVIPALLFSISWQFPPLVRLDSATLGHADIGRGLYDPEQSAAGPYRWSHPDAAVRLPAANRPTVIGLRAARSPGEEPLWLGVGKEVVLALPPSDGPTTFRRYWLLRPAQSAVVGWEWLDIHAQAPAMPAEERALGMALASVSVHGWDSLETPPVAPLLALLVISSLLVLLLRLAGLPQSVALMVATPAAVLAGELWVRRPLAVLPLMLDLGAFGGNAAVWRWWLVVEAVGLLALPVTAVVFRSLPMRGYPFSKALGLLSVGYGSWLLAALRLAPFRLPTVVAVSLLMALLGWWNVRRDGRGLLDALRARWRGIVACEILFGCALFFGLWLRWHGAGGPMIVGLEKPMELALLSSVLGGRHFPPPDPWLAGYPLNYYYLGYVIIATLALGSGVTAGQAFNLSIATVYALAAVMVAGLVVTLIELSLRSEQRPFQPRRWSVAAAALLAVVLLLGAGNQLGALQLLVGSSAVRALDAGQLAEAVWQRVNGEPQVLLSRPTPPVGEYGSLARIVPSTASAFNWWAASRAVWGDVQVAPGKVERAFVITEFPFFSFYVGDLHPHLIALPFGLLVLAIAVAAAVDPPALALRGARRGWFETMLVGMVLGSIYAINSWDAPTYAALFAGALALGYRRHALEGNRDYTWRRYLLTLGGTASAGLVLIAPFLVTFQPPAAGGASQGTLANIPILRTIARTFALSNSHTPWHGFLIAFGLFAVVLLAFALRSHSAPSPPAGSDRGRGRRWSRRLWWDGRVWTVGTLLVGVVSGFPLLALLPFGLTLAWQAWTAARHPVRAVVLWTTATGALVVFAADSIYFRDQFESRMITVFKFYYQAWLLWGSLTAYAVWALLPSPWSRRRASLFWLLPAGLLLVGALLYPLTTLRRGERSAPPERVLDGLAYLPRTAPGDAAVIGWLASNAAPDDVLLTAFCHCSYDEIGRIAAVTGIPTLLGWVEGHERIWRSGSDEALAEISRREKDVPTIYTTTDIGQTRRLLDSYGVRYVVVGDAERRLYPGPGLDKFDQFLTPVFQQGRVAIYSNP